MRKKKNGSLMTQLNLWLSKDLRDKLVKAHEDFVKKHDIKVSLGSFVKSLLEKQLNKEEEKKVSSTGETLILSAGTGKGENK